MYKFHCNRRLHLIIYVLILLISRSISTDETVESKQLDDNQDDEYSSSEETFNSVSDKLTDRIKLSESQSSDEEQEEEGSDGILVDEYNMEQEEIFAEDFDEEHGNSSIVEDINEDISQEEEEEVEEEEEEDDDDDEDIENNSETPEMERANILYHQAMRLINVTTNRQYEAAYKLFQQAANLGHIKAKEELALAHLIGVYLPMNFKIAKEYFEEGAQLGSPQSNYGLYFMNSVGLIPNSSIPKALVYLTFAAADGYHIAQMALGYRYWRAVNFIYNCESALMYYKEVATYVVSKITPASSLIVQRIRLHDAEEQQTQNNIFIDNNLLQYYQFLADRGDPHAQYGIGQLYYFRDIAFDKALYYFRLAAENGNTNAVAYLGKLYSEKNDFIKQNNQTAFQFFHISAEKGNPIGQAGLGLAYYHGAGVEKNYDKAFKLFKLSADQSYGEGQFMLGVLYYYGHGVQQDLKLALKWFQAASQSGHILAYYNLAEMYATGTGVIQSCSTAIEYFKIVAERGPWSNMFTKAFQLYSQGHIEQAFMIYLYLAEMGYEIAQSNVAHIIDQMPFDISNWYKTEEERNQRAFIYWSRSANQGFHFARIKLGDYYYYGQGTEQNYELAAAEYKSANDLSRSSQAMFNLGYMHEKGLGLKQDMHLAKRFYDMALESNNEAYLPVVLVLFRLEFENFFKNLFSNLFFHVDEESSKKSSTINRLSSSWDIYLIVILTGLIGVLYTIRRQRNATQQQQQVRFGVQ